MVMLTKSYEFSLVCEVVISCDIDIPFVFLERVADGFTGLSLRGGGDGHLALFARISKSTNRYPQALEVHIPPGHMEVTISLFFVECSLVGFCASYITCLWLCVCVCVCVCVYVLLSVIIHSSDTLHKKIITQKRSD